MFKWWWKISSFRFEPLQCDQVDVRRDRIDYIIDLVNHDNELIASEMLISDFASIRDCCCMTLSKQEIVSIVNAHFEHEFEDIDIPVWQLVDYITENVGWPDHKH